MRTTWDAAADSDRVEHYVGDPATARSELESLFSRLGGDPRGGTCVEVGCGFGRMTAVLAERFDRVVALDVSPRMLELARAAVPAPNVELDLVSGSRLDPVEDGVADALAMRDGLFEAQVNGRVLRARRVLLATGARDVVPELPGVDEGLAAGNVRYCPVCDGFETQQQRVAVLGRGIHGLSEALFVAGFDNHVTWLSMGSQDAVPPEAMAQLRQGGVLIADQMPLHIRCMPGQGVEVEMVDGRRLVFDVLYPALGLQHASGLATTLGGELQANGQLLVDDHLQTTVPGLYAAGDVAAGLNQIAVAYGHAAIAATAIHNSL